MTLSILVQESRKGNMFEYCLLVCAQGELKPHHIGYALKEFTYDDGLETFPLHTLRKTIARDIGTTYDFPTPALLQLFCGFRLEDQLNEEKRQNMSAGDELDLVGKIIRKLEEIDPGLFYGTPQTTHLGGNEITPQLVDKIRTIKEHIYTPQHL